MAKYDWEQLKKEYILGDHKSVKEFLRSKNIKSTGNTNKQTKGWSKKKAIKEQQKSNKTVEKVIEKQSEKEAQQIADIKFIANELALNVLKANTELNKHIAKSKTKTKTVTYDPKALKPSKEETKEQEEVNEYISIIDRQGLKMLASALKDLNEILTDKQGNNETDLNNVKEVLIKIKEVANNGQDN